MTLLQTGKHGKGLDGIWVHACTHRITNIYIYIYTCMHTQAHTVKNSKYFCKGQNHDTNAMVGNTHNVTTVIHTYDSLIFQV